MKRLLPRLLIVLAAGAALFTGLNAVALTAQAGSFLTQRSFLVPLAGTAILAWAARRWSMPAQFRLVLLCLAVIGAELLLSAAAWCGWLPGVATKEKCAFGRVYWRGEGHGNSIRNRDGWHAPAFTRDAARRVAVIGDSFVEAVEVHRTDIHAVRLGAELRRAGKDIAITPLGTHGTSPAHHREVIDYAARHWQPQEVILVLFLGNDLSDMTPETSGVPPERYLYYEFGPDQRLALNPASTRAREAFVAGLEFSHRSLLTQAPAILRSHSMLAQSCNSLRDRLAQRREQTARTAHAGAAEHDAAGLGLNPAPFADPETPLARRCLDLLLAQLDLCADACARHGIALRLVTVPAFPSEFYRTQPGPDWTAKLGGYDYLRPEREIAAFAAKRGWPCLALGARMQTDRLTPATIRSFYFLDGVGHFTEAGHQFCAEAMRAAFFRD